jgi:hypothetical protein
MKDSVIEFIFVIGFVATMFILIWGTGYIAGQRATRYEAVKSGVGHFEGEDVFVWTPKVKDTGK